MTVRPQVIFGLLLSVIIALTSVSMSLARGQMRDASGHMVLCTGHGPMVVQLGADGEPIERLGICPECALGFFEYDLANRLNVTRSMAEYEVQYSEIAFSCLIKATLTANARGPPSVCD